MTVRSWFAISALVVFALAGAFLLRAFAPVHPPAIVARVGSVRVGGSLESSCWPDRSGKTRCQVPKESFTEAGPSIPRSGTIRLLVAYPVQPRTGRIRVRTFEERTVLTEKWTRRLSYRLRPGNYSMTARARYAKGVYVSYYFLFKVSRSGS